MYRRLFPLSLACLLAACVSSTAPDESSALEVPTDHASAERLIVEARSYLDRWNGEQEILDEAMWRVDLVTEHVPDYAPGWVAAARVELDAGTIGDHRFAPGTLERAAEMLSRASMEDPQHSDANVHLGFVLTRLRQYEDADQQLSIAEAAGSTHPWLPEYRAQWFDATGSRDKAVEARERIVASSKDARVLQRSRFELAQHHKRRGDLDRAEAEFVAIIATDPSRAWSYGNFGHFLLHHRGQPDRAVEQLQRALEIQPYGSALHMLESARYVQWADAVLAKDMARADALAANMDFETELLRDHLTEIAVSEILVPRIGPLLQKGVDLNTPDSRRMIPLVIAAANSTPSHVAALIKAGAEVDAPDGEGDTAMEIAALRGRMEIMRVLIAQGADLNRVGSGGSLLLNRAISHQADEAVRVLLEAGADPNRSSLKAETPLILVAWTADPERAKHLTRLLLDHGGDPRIKHPMLGKDAIVMARERQLTEVVAMMEAQVKRLESKAK